MLKGIAALLLLALGLLITTPCPDSGRPLLAAFCGLLAASWLGVLAFQGDGVQERIRFLADRGVAPATVWWTRHAPPLSLLAMALGLMVLLLPDQLRASHLSSLSLLAVVMAALFTYTVSQVVGQVFRSATIAAIAAPLVTWVLAAYGVSLVGLAGRALLAAGPVRVASLAGDIPADAALDGRPLGVGLLGRARRLSGRRPSPAPDPRGTGPGLATDHARGIPAPVAGRGGRLWRTDAEPRELVLRFRNPELPAGTRSNRRLEAQIVCTQLEHDLSVDPGPIRFMPRAMVYLLGEARLARLALEQDGDAEADRERYRRTLSLIGVMVDRMRLSWRIFDQDGADLIEIWLVEELAGSQARSWLGSELFGRLVRAVSDGPARQAARRRAVAMSWADCRTCAGCAGRLVRRICVERRIGLAPVSAQSFPAPQGCRLSRLADAATAGPERAGERRADEGAGPVLGICRHCITVWVLAASTGGPTSRPVLRCRWRASSVRPPAASGTPVGNERPANWRTNGLDECELVRSSCGTACLGKQCGDSRHGQQVGRATPEATSKRIHP